MLSEQKSAHVLVSREVNGLARGGLEAKILPDETLLDALNRGRPTDQPLLRVEMGEAQERDGRAFAGADRWSQEADAVWRDGRVAACAVPVRATEGVGMSVVDRNARRQWPGPRETS